MRIGGLKIVKYCNCGKYKPISTRGLIIDNCRNCGGKPKPMRFGPLPRRK